MVTKCSLVGTKCSLLFYSLVTKCSLVGTKCSQPSKLTDALDDIPEREVVLHAVLHASNADAHEAVILGAKRRLSCRHCHD